MNKVCIYPFSSSFEPVLKYGITHYDINSIVTFYGNKYDNKALSSLDAIKDYDLKKGLNNSNVLLLADIASDLLYNSKDKILSNISGSIENVDLIINTIKTDVLFHDELQELCRTHKKKYIYWLNNHINYIPKPNQYLFDFNCPIVFILGENENCDKFETQLSIRKKLINDGYKVSQIGSRHYCELLGFHSFPEFMFKSDFTETEKIYLFNNLVKDIEINEKPDIIVVGIPGSILPYDKKITRNFGVVAYEVCMAINPDFPILNLQSNNIKTEFIELLSNIFKYRFGIVLDCINFSNKQTLWKNTKDEHKYDYITISENKLIEELKHFNAMLPVFCTVNEPSHERLYNFMIKTLAAYDEVSII